MNRQNDSDTSLTPLADLNEPVIRHLEAQLPETRRVLAYERRQKYIGMIAEDCRPDDGGAR